MKYRLTYMILFLTASLTAQNFIDGPNYGELALESDGSVAIQDDALMPKSFLGRIVVPNDSLDRLDTEKDRQVKPIYVANYLNIYSDGQYRASLNTTSGTYVQEADSRNKKKVRSLDDMLRKVLLLKPVSYLMKDQENQDRSLGLVSQEVREVFPSLVHHIDEEERLALSYTELIPVLIKAIQEQQQIIQNLKDNQFTMQKEFAAVQLQLAQLTNSQSGKETALQNDDGAVAQN